MQAKATIYFVVWWVLLEYSTFELFPKTHQLKMCGHICMFSVYVHVKDVYSEGQLRLKNWMLKIIDIYLLQCTCSLVTSFLIHVCISSDQALYLYNLLIFFFL